MIFYSLNSCHSTLPSLLRCSFERRDCRGQPFWKTNPRIDVISYSDASDSGWGGYCVNVAGTNMVGSWSEA